MTRVTYVRELYDVYVGSAFGGLKESQFHNPFRKYGNGLRSMRMFMEYWYAPEQKDLRKRSLTLAGKTLGCWCKRPHLICHGDIIAGYVDWKTSKTLVNR